MPSLWGCFAPLHPVRSALPHARRLSSCPMHVFWPTPPCQGCAANVAFPSLYTLSQPTFTLRWLIQQCPSAQHMWLPVTPLCKPFVNPSAGSHSGGFMCKQGKLDGQIPTTVQVGQLYLVSSILNSLCVTCLHTHTHTCTHTHTHTCTHTRAHTHTLVGCCVLLFRYIFVWPTCVDVHLLLCAHTHTYTHTHTHTMEASIIKSCVGK